MFLASAYPNTALSALTLMVIGFVVAASLAAWLGLVFLADRAPRERRVTVARLGARDSLEAAGTAGGEHGDDAEHHGDDAEHGTAAEHGAAA